MRIGIDTTFLFDQYSQRGIGTYGRELISRLCMDKDHEWYLFGFKRKKDNLAELGLRAESNIKFISLGKARSSNPLNPILFRFGYLKKIHDAKLDLYFAPHFERGLPIGKVKTAVMMHDVIPFITGNYSQTGKLKNFFKGLFYKYNLNKARKADMIFTNSDFSKRELINKAGFKPEKVSRIYLGVNNSFRIANQEVDIRDVRRVLVMYKISQPYLLYYGGLEANKNINALIHAFRNVIPRHPDLKLVIAGKDFKVGWDNKPIPQTLPAQELLELIAELKLKHNIIITGAIEGKHLPLVVSQANAFVHLSTYEGFGFSVLEALAAGTPVIASRRSSYPEVLEDAAILVDPDNLAAIAESILAIIQDEKEQKRLRTLGEKLSNKYRWQNTADETIQKFKQLGNVVIPLKLGYLITYFHPIKGGAENNCLELAKQMAKHGHEVTVFTSMKKQDNFPLEETYAGIKIKRFRRINNQYYLGMYPGLFMALLRGKFDILHVHGFGFMWHDICLLVKRFISRNTAIVNTPHGPFMALKDYSLKLKILKATYSLISRIFLNRIYDAVIAVNPTQEKWITGYGIPNKKIQYLPNGIPASLLTKGTTISGRPSKKFVISFIGRYEKYKGLSDLITAFAEVKTKHKQIELKAIGSEGKYLETVKKQVKQLNLEKDITLMVNPTDQEKDEVLAESKIFVLPSQWEAFGISILEAMAKGNAIISTRTEGGRFLVNEGENGYLYEYGDTVDLAHQLSKLIENKEILKNISKNNRAKAAMFDWDSIALTYYEFLKLIKK